MNETRFNIGTNIKSYFARPDKAGTKELSKQIQTISKNEVMSGLLQTVSGLLAILNEQRQILAVNDSFLKILGIDDAEKTLGLKPGEALKCIHAEDKPAGCGTTKYCSTCGAAISIVSSLDSDTPVEKKCVLEVKNSDNKTTSMTLNVKSHPIKINNMRFLLLFIQDITLQQQLVALEKIFFHDINNMLTAIVGASDLLCENDSSDLAKIIHKTSERLVKEIAVQRLLFTGAKEKFKPNIQKVQISDVITELNSFFNNHHQGRQKQFFIVNNYPDLIIKTDNSLIFRILSNMLLNAMEASDKGDVIKLWIEIHNKLISFFIQNKKEIPPNISCRIFQRNFSTRDESGRGLGTYSMKFLGEDILNGKVSFTSSNVSGTVFSFTFSLE